jgi:methionyl-tRNA synthetase
MPRGPRDIVTTPLYYVNAQAHLGHAYSSVLADALARYMQRDLITGTDEHGRKVELAARARALPMQEFCDRVAVTFQTMTAKMDVHAASLVRTTSPAHALTVQNLWSRLRPHIELGQHQGWYCASDEAFVAEADVDLENKRTRALHQPVEWVSEPNYKFTFHPKQLKSQVAGMQILPSARQAEVAAWLDVPGPASLSVSRPRERVPWALPVPGDDKHSIYVWVDALAGYLTAAGLRLDPDPARPALVGGTAHAMGAAWPRDAIHVVGKDILRFHAVIWPALLLAAGLELPSKVIAHAHWTAEGRKMSKSIGNVVDPLEVLRGPCAGSSDAMRYFLLRHAPLEDDADFSVRLVAKRANTDLGDNVGNLLARVTARALWANITEADLRDVKLDWAQHQGVGEAVHRAYERGDFARGLEAVAGMIHQANANVQSREPWKDAKAAPADSAARQRLVQTLAQAINSLRVAAVFLAPVTPQIADRLFAALNIPDWARRIQGARDRTLDMQRPVVGAPILFAKLPAV